MLSASDCAISHAPPESSAREAPSDRPVNETPARCARRTASTSSSGATGRWRCAGVPLPSRGRQAIPVASTATCTYRHFEQPSKTSSPNLSAPPCTMPPTLASGESHHPLGGPLPRPHRPDTAVDSLEMGSAARIALKERTNASVTSWGSRTVRSSASTEMLSWST